MYEQQPNPFTGVPDGRMDAENPMWIVVLPTHDPRQEQRHLQTLPTVFPDWSEAMIHADEIIKMSAQAGFTEVFLSWPSVPDKLTAFAALVSARAAKDEREACAKVCEEKGKSYIERASQPRVIKDIDDWTAEIAAMACDFAATAIRARGDKDEQ